MAINAFNTGAQLGVELLHKANQLPWSEYMAVNPNTGERYAIKNSPGVMQELSIEQAPELHALLSRQIESMPDFDPELHSIDSTMMLARYETNSSIPLHDDCGTININGTPSHVKHSLMFYLNDADGGELHFPERDITIKPTLGAGAVFNAEEIHQVNTVNSGVRYGLLLRSYYPI